MEEQKSFEKEAALESVISKAVQMPGVKVNRDKFLAEAFANENIVIQDIIDLGPVQAGVPQETIYKIASKLILKRTGQSSVASFAFGIPGGMAIAATIPADILQFFALAIRLAQELSYLYGADDLWENGQIDDEKIQKQLLLYCGVMFGVSGAVSGIRILSSQLSKVALKKIPQRALTKEFWYKILTKICKILMLKMNKTLAAKGVSMAIPVVGGVISGGLNFVSMVPMARRLLQALDSASFDYTEEDLENDIYIIENIDLNDIGEERTTDDIKDKIIEGGKKIGEGVSYFFTKKKDEALAKADSEDVFEAIKKLAELKEMGILSQEEFDDKKAELLAKI